MVIVPKNFNGEKFSRKFNLDPYKDFFLGSGSILVCPSIPDLTQADIEDCIGPSETVPALEEFIDAYAQERDGIPGPMIALLARFARTKKPANLERIKDK